MISRIVTQRLPRYKSYLYLPIMYEIENMKPIYPFTHLPLSHKLLPKVCLTNVVINPQKITQYYIRGTKSKNQIPCLPKKVLQKSNQNFFVSFLIILLRIVIHTSIPIFPKVPPKRNHLKIHSYNYHQKPICIYN